MFFETICVVDSIYGHVGHKMTENALIQVTAHRNFLKTFAHHSSSPH